MPSTQPNAAKVWKQLEDDLVPRLRLSVIDKAVYAHLLRHTRLEGKSRLHFSIAWLARGTRLSCSPTRQAIRRLLHHGALRLVERSKAGHMIEVRLPHQIPITRSNEMQLAGPDRSSDSPHRDLEQTDFLRNNVLRQSIHSREHGRCFYCLRQTTCRVQCLDNVIPAARLGLNSYRNLVSSCLDCNSQKGEGSAADFFRSLYREGRLTASELAARLRALDDLAAGKLRPIFSTSANPLPRKGRPPLNPGLPQSRNKSS